jgi:outer membrane biosynthesis protein TonB
MKEVAIKILIGILGFIIIALSVYVVTNEKEDNNTTERTVTHTVKEESTGMDDKPKKIAKEVNIEVKKKPKNHSLVKKPVKEKTKNEKAVVHEIFDPESIDMTDMTDLEKDITIMDVVYRQGEQVESTPLTQEEEDKLIMDDIASGILK